ncbi:hypothetical protein [Serratia plymuthica]|nr:hypothetical protein [Serratia plymuthica]UTN98633.1 hypothetical protein NLX81_10390 [Serratia plymuthica]
MTEDKATRGGFSENRFPGARGARRLLRRKGQNAAAGHRIQLAQAM